ncbi:CcoQ/FixQ family Cbb3-type cytochrome c oxidase assembly chaperone [uncultured Paenalcaligenes sp.]|uniref:cbb3-type cytochrome oxidase subunit 3 n=1 Tax=uncultured Paenalcaligenes sp. TaxID=1588925 RepID=UPI0026058557|nr:CcoQ/FixQ family Cbb3-type cytochrome c oxidase assembly chaperone [uncultured Paenalcaligenes sp.]
MVGILNGIATALALITFLGIVVWAWSRGRSKANHDASMLPFDLPDERQVEKPKVGDSNE